MHEIRYVGGSVSGLSYCGRNRYGRQAGIAITVFDREGRRVIRLNPITSRDTISDVCHIEVSAEAMAAIVSALQSFINPESSEVLGGRDESSVAAAEVQAVTGGGLDE